MRFLGFFMITEWDGSTSTCSAQEERAYLDEFMHHGVDYYVYITYQDGVTHKVDKRYWDSLPKRYNKHLDNGQPFAR